MNTKIISAFPASGKSYIYKNSKELFQDMKREEGRYPIILDSDSSLYSWIWKDNIKTDERNPEFPKNYIKHIFNNMNKVDYIFVSSHTIVRKALADSRLDFTLVVPDKSLLTEYMIRMIERGNDDSFVNLLIDNWDKWLNEIDEEKNTYKQIIKLKRNQYLSDIILKI